MRRSPILARASYHESDAKGIPEPVARTVLDTGLTVDLRKDALAFVARELTSVARMVPVEPVERLN